jgi:ATP-binding cassette, subfamily C (CFTR/MRP), member 1
MQNVIVITLLILTENHYTFQGMVTGYLMRSALTASIARKSLRLSGAGRVKHPNGSLVSYISTDVSFMDWAAFLVHGIWVLPTTIIIGIILLLINLGYSALVGVLV